MKICSAAAGPGGPGAAHNAAMAQRAVLAASRFNVSKQRTDAPGSEDVLLVLEQADGGRLRGIRQREGQLELAELAPIAEGQPLSGELVRLSPREGHPVLLDVQTLYQPEQTAPTVEPTPCAGHKGPARVNTEAFRDGWDRVFGASPRARLPN